MTPQQRVNLAVEMLAIAMQELGDGGTIGSDKVEYKGRTYSLTFKEVFKEVEQS